MKISDISQDGNVIQYVQQNGKTTALGKNQISPAEQNQSPAEDKVDLSAESKEMNKIHDVLAATPDVRTEQVDALKKSIESGQYDVKSDALATKMIKEFLTETNQ